jgi:hypothetical protein
VKQAVGTLAFGEQESFFLVLLVSHDAFLWFIIANLTGLSGEDFGYVVIRIVCTMIDSTVSTVFIIWDKFEFGKGFLEKN